MSIGQVPVDILKVGYNLNSVKDPYQSDASFTHEVWQNEDDEHEGAKDLNDEDWLFKTETVFVYEG